MEQRTKVENAVEDLGSLATWVERVHALVLAQDKQIQYLINMVKYISNSIEMMNGEQDYEDDEGTPDED